MRRSVLLVGNFLSFSGRNQSVSEELAARLGAAGWFVVTTSSRFNRLARLFDMVSTSWHQRHQCEVAHVDVFSGPAFLWAESVCWMLRRVGVPYVLTLRGGNLPAFAQRWSGHVQRLLGSAAAVTAPSLYLLEQMRSYRSNIRLLPNPLDLNSYRFRLRKRPQAHLVWLRAIHNMYNPLLALKAMELLDGDFPKCRLTMVGPDKGDGTFGQLQHVIAELGLTDRVSLPGGVPRSEVPKWMNTGDIFLNTTNVDNSPVSVLEALASGMCVVSTNVGGIPYMLENERDALLVPPDDPEAMALAIRRVLTTPTLAERLSAGARKKAERLDWSAILPHWEVLLTSVAHGHLA
jgi:glycosyltransferase involved in cell wall biosynthesis